jgi:hypothetical protein
LREVRAVRERGVALEVIRSLAGHVDVRTTQIYVDVTDQRKADGSPRSSAPRTHWPRRRSGQFGPMPDT